MRFPHALGDVTACSAAGAVGVLLVGLGQTSVVIEAPGPHAFENAILILPYLARYGTVVPVLGAALAAVRLRYVHAAPRAIASAGGVC